MGKNKNKNGKREKSAMKCEKKLVARQKKILSKLKEVDIAEIVAQLEAEETRLTAVNETVCPPPSPRSCFTLISHPTKEQIILFGGEFFNGQIITVYNDLFFYNIGKHEWKQLHSPAGPAARSAHQMVAVSTDGGQLWLFGGEYASPSQKQFYHYKDLWVLRMNTKKWEKINAPNGPSARSGHRMITVKKKLVIFGGFYDNNHAYKYYNDLHMFSLETYTWLKFDLNYSILPPPRSGCCMAACPDGKILIWSGYSKSQVKKDVDRGVVHTDMFALVPDTNDKFKWTSLKPGGFKPLPRSSMGCAVGSNGKAYCFGGVMDVDEDEESINGQFCNELLALDLSKQKWRLFDTVKNSKTTKNVECQVSNSGNNFKGTTVSNEGLITVTDENFSIASVSPMPSSSCNNDISSLPSPRMNPGMCVCRNNLYIFGGLIEDDTKQVTLNDFYALDLHKLEWRVLIPNNKNAHEWVESESCSESSSESSDDMESSDDESDMDTN